MSAWSLEKAKNQFSEVVRRALAHQPQVVTRGGRDAVVVVALEDYERLATPGNLVDFLRRSPLAAAIDANELPPDAFDRARDLPRHLDL
jgi:prevent-host-death family protein